MKLYFMRGACSFAPHVLLREAGLPFELIKRDRTTNKTSEGVDYATINPKGYVPALQLDDGQVLTEVAVIVQYLADLAPEKNLIPRAGTMERYRAQEWLNYIATEIHKTFAPLWNPALPADQRAAIVEQLGKKFDFVDKSLAGREHALGAFSAVDAYLFTVLSWAKLLKIDLERWPAIRAYLERVLARPSVQAARDTEKQLG
jgi:glutathione S-transferase